MTAAGVLIDPATLCADCDKPWSEHWGFNCDEPYALRKFKPLLSGRYPPNRDAPERLADALAEISRLRALCERSCAALEMKSDRGARLEWAAAIRQSISTGEGE